MKQRDISPEQAIKQIQKIFKKRGTKALEMARKEILQEKIECKEAKEALTYFMMEYWHDLVRPALLSIVCEAVGGDPDATTSIAVPMILISGAIDIHDDIIDQSKRKDGRPTVYGKFGKDIALLVGDALLFKGFTLLHQTCRQISIDKMTSILDIMRSMFFELGDAEALELQFRGRIDVKPEEYLRVVKKKAADAEAYMRISAILGDGSEKEIEALGKYGRFFGMLAILRDDIIDMMDPDEIIQRIRYESLPLPLLYGLQDSKVKAAISSILLKRKKTKKDIESVYEFTKKVRALEKTERTMQDLVEEGVRSLRILEDRGAELKLLIRFTLTH